MQPVTAADYHEIAKPADPRLSPDGEQVAFLRKQALDDERTESTVYLVDCDGSRPPRRLTLAEGVDAEPRWSPSGDRLAFTSTRGEDDRSQLWILPIDGGEARRVTNVVGGVSDIAWSPDGERLAFVQSVTPEDREEGRDLSVPDDYEPADHPDPRVIDRTVYRTAQQHFDGRRPGIYLVDADATVEGAEADDDPAITRLTDREADFGSPAFGDAETLYYTESVGEDPDDSYAIAIHAHDLANVAFGDDETGGDDGDDGDGDGSTEDDAVERIHTTYGWGTPLAATADGRVAFAHVEPDQASLRQTDLQVFDRHSGEVVNLTADLDRGLGYEAAPMWGPDDDTLYFSTADEGAVAVWAAPGDGSVDPERVVRKGMVSGATVAGPIDAGPERVTVAFATSEWDHPGDLFVYDATADETRRLTTLNAAFLAERHVGEPEEIRFDSDGTEIQGWVLTPPDGGADPDRETHPLVVEVHGGPHAMWSPSGTMWHEFQTLAARGYVVFWSNPRGSAGYGAEHMAAIERDWGAVTLSDVMAGVDVVAERADVDEEDVFLTGGSFGGFMTAWAVGNTDRFRAAVAQRGVYDLTGFYGSTDGAYKLLEGDFDTTPIEEPAWLWEQSPTGHVTDVDTPTLLIHAEDDTRTPICTAELYHRLLRKKGVETRFVRYPREGHELSRSGEPGHIVDRIERIARWFDGYSTHHDAPKALDRPEGEGLTAEADEADSAAEDDE
ncbi:S9 family peptidase [Halorubrum vacuolatum]|uniref:Dipeptidyl aminopeptidase/acylaminoacyl peptidase n=1 Tax=Halorubrum vacuolatum TaxID=63740 RepID=A0A238WEU8_HALVU|nr:S9 family peptidase [Halorubrum vacuolatum]SNR44967.1 Dipeptidyl aminopeptidase/acylaminoacyl peptidase [Halorubrum vacuolatum]